MSGIARKGDPMINQKPPAAPLFENPQVPRGDSRTGDASNADPQGMRPNRREEPWVAELPPEVRGAIRANSRRPPPRGYEERLQRYFKNID